MFDDIQGKGEKDKAVFRALADHARISEYLPTSLIATVSAGHPILYVIMEVKNSMLPSPCNKGCQTEFVSVLVDV